MEHFNYHSQQVHSVMVNDKLVTNEKNVSIINGKGTKSILVTTNGKTRKAEKALNKNELRCIRKHKYVPGLFNDCIKNVNARLLKKNTRKSHNKKTRSRK